MSPAAYVIYFALLALAICISGAAHLLYTQRQRHLGIARQEAQRLTKALEALNCEIHALRHELKAERENGIRAAAGLYGLDNLT